MLEQMLVGGRDSSELSNEKMHHFPLLHIIFIVGLTHIKPTLNCFHFSFNDIEIPHVSGAQLSELKPSSLSRDSWASMSEGADRPFLDKQ